MNNQTMKRVTTILFFGSLWGLIEATLGYLLHFLPVLVAGGILFPLATGILVRTYQVSGKRMDLVLVGFLAAIIKSVNLLMPQISIWKTINPMMSILFEALCVVMVIAVVQRNQPVIAFAVLPLASIIWRGLYLGYMGIQYQVTGFLSIHLESVENILSFVLLYGVMSGLIAGLFAFWIVYLKKRWQLPWEVRATLALPMLGLAILLTVFL